MEMTLAQRIKKLRKQKGYSVAALSRESGISHPYLRQIELGIKKNPSGTVLHKLAVALGTTVADLLGTPQGIDEQQMGKVPPSLRQLARRKGKQIGLRKEDVEMLKGIHFRGKRPANMQDWELIYLFLKRILG